MFSISEGHLRRERPPKSAQISTLPLRISARARFPLRTRLSETLFEVEDLEIRYGQITVVRELSFGIGRGEIVGVIGPNGAGKTTTLRAIMGLVPVFGGDIRLRGSSLVGRS